MPPEEILEALKRGGFDFEKQGWEKQPLRSLAISLSKNSLIFHRLPNGTYGLVKFYPGLEEKKQRRTPVEDLEEVEGEVEEEGEEEGEETGE